MDATSRSRLAKNTLILYCRMFVTMLISLYTSRVVLASLGVDDYGIYNVVGGFVAMFSMISGTLSASISRFITFEMGRDNHDRLKSIFSNSINAQLFLSIIILIFGETVGLWFINNQLTIPESRLNAAIWVYHFSLVSFVFGLLATPFTAFIIANENMSVFAKISIVDAIARLICAIIVSYATIDKLILYAFLMFLIILMIDLIYMSYCHRRYEDCKYKPKTDKSLLKQLFSFAGWNFIGSSSSILRDQGGNILINIFYGPAVNAARGIAMQVNGAIVALVGNFSTALSPQITKSFASNNLDEHRKLIYLGARVSFYLLIVTSLPVLFNTDYLLNLWLKNVPNHSSMFVKLMIICALSESLSVPLVTSQLATGRIRNYQIVVGLINLLNFPFAYIALKLGMVPETVFIIAIVMSQICLFARLIMIKNLINMKPFEYIKIVYKNVLIVTIFSLVLPVVFSFLLNNTFLSFIISCIICVLSSITVILFLGLSKNERLLIAEKIKMRIKSI